MFSFFKKNKTRASATTDIHVTSLLGELLSANAKTAIDAAIKISDSEDERFTAPILKMLKETDNPRLIGSFLRALASSKDPAKIDFVLGLTSDSRPTVGDTGNPVGQIAFWALQNMNDPRIAAQAKAVINKFRDKVHMTFPCDICVAAVRTLSNFPGEETRSYLQSLIPLGGRVADEAKKLLDSLS